MEGGAEGGGGGAEVGSGASERSGTTPDIPGGAGGRAEARQRVPPSTASKGSLLSLRTEGSDGGKERRQLTKKGRKASCCLLLGCWPSDC